MSTTFFPTNVSLSVTVPSTLSSGTQSLLQITSRGSGVQTQTDNTSASPQSSWGSTFVCCFWGSSTSVTQDNAVNSGTLVFITNPLNAVTISGTISANIRARESNAMANYGVGITVFKLTGDGTTRTRFCYAADTTNELGTSDAAFSMSGTPTSTNLADGDRLVLLIGYHAQGGSAASGFTASGTYNGTSAGSSGDTSVTFTETITEQAVAQSPAPAIRHILQAVNRAATY